MRWVSSYVSRMISWPTNELNRIIYYFILFSMYFSMDDNLAILKQHQIMAFQEP